MNESLLAMNRQATVKLEDFGQNYAKQDENGSDGDDDDDDEDEANHDPISKSNSNDQQQMNDKIFTAKPIIIKHCSQQTAKKRRLHNVNGGSSITNNNNNKKTTKTTINNSLESISSDFSISSATNGPNATELANIVRLQVANNGAESPPASGRNSIRLLSAADVIVDHELIQCDGDGGGGGSPLIGFREPPSIVDRHLPDSLLLTVTSLQSDHNRLVSSNCTTTAALSAYPKSYLPRQLTAHINDNSYLSQQQQQQQQNMGALNEQITVKSGDKQVEEKQAPAPKPVPPFKFAGILGSIASSFVFSISCLCLKLLPEHEGFVGKMKALFFRGFFMSILCAITILCSQSTFIIRRDEIWVNLLRAIFGTLAVFGSYSSLIYIGMGDATALIFSSPIWTSILSHFLLKEPLHYGQLMALPISLLGIVLIAHPGLILDVDHMQSLNNATNKTLEAQFSALFNETNASPLANATHLPYHAPQGDQLIGADIALAIVDPELTGSLEDSFDQRWPGIVIALATSLLVSLTFIVLKFRKSTPVQTTTFWFGITMMLFSTVVMCFNGFGEMPSSLYEWSLLLGNGVFSWIGQIVFQWSFNYEEAGILSITRTLDVATTFTLSALFLTDPIYWTSVVGATVIVAVVLSIMLNNYIQQMTCCTHPGKKDSTVAPPVLKDKSMAYKVDEEVA